MGGKALKTAYTRRYNKQEFIDISEEVLNMIKDKVEALTLKYYSNKETFGDLDILIKDENLSKEDKENLINLFNPTEIHKNSETYSFDYKELQIDFIFVKPENFESSYNYFAYNDLGNLIGKIAHNFGLKFGQEGLKKVIYNENRNIIGTIILTKNIYRILDFLGFDKHWYNSGFKDLEEIFDFVRSSKYYSPDIFGFEHMNRVNRERDSKRNTYNAFLEYIKNDQNTLNFFSNKEFYYGFINLHFPNFYYEYNELHIS